MNLKNILIKKLKNSILSLFFPLQNYDKLPLILSTDELAVCKGIMLGLLITFIFLSIFLINLYIFQSTNKIVIVSPSLSLILLEYIFLKVLQYLKTVANINILLAIGLSIVGLLFILAVFQWISIFFVKLIKRIIFYIKKQVRRDKAKNLYKVEYVLLFLLSLYITLALFLPPVISIFLYKKSIESIGILAVFVSIYAIQANLSIYFIDKLRAKVREFFLMFFVVHSLIFSIYLSRLFGSAIRIPQIYEYIYKGYKEPSTNIAGDLLTMIILMVLYFVSLIIVATYIGSVYSKLVIEDVKKDEK